MANDGDDELEWAEGWADPAGLEDGPPFDDGVDDGVDDGGDDVVENAAEDDVHHENALPSSIERWRRRTASGAILTGIALGLQQVFDPEKRNQPAIVQQRADEPDDDKATSVDLDSENPLDTRFVVRPWLMEDEPPTGDS